MSDHAPRIGRRALLAGLAASPLLGACGDDAPAAPRRPPRDEAVPRTERMAYGGQPQQFGELTFPATRDLPRGTVLVVHGGFWRAGTDLTVMQPVVDALVAANFAVWNIEYRTVNAGGGWPSTFDDVAMAADHLATLRSTRLDLRRLVVLGHSAGGHLAGWLAMRAKLAPGDPGAAPAVRPAGVVSLAGVLDLAGGMLLGDGAVADLVAATPAADPARFRATSPLEAVPLGVPSVCVHGTADEVVPLSQSEDFVAAATAAGDRSELVRVEGANHLQLIDVRHPGWAAALAAVERLSAPA